MVSQAVLFAPADRHESCERSAHALRSPVPPLALLPVGNRPLVLHAVDELEAAGVEHITIVSEGAVASDVQAAIGDRAISSRLRHRAVDPEASFVEALQAVAEDLDDKPFAVHLCDSLRHDGLDAQLGGSTVGARDVVALVEPQRSDITPVTDGLSSVRTAGVYLFGTGVLELGDEADAPIRWDAQIANLAERLEQAGGHVELRTAPNCWRYRQRPDVLLQANRFFLSGLKAAPTDAWLENTDLQGPVAIHQSARIRSSTIRGPVIIGPDVEVSDAYIGPYSSIGRGVIIENAEVEHSILLPGSSIRHLGGRLEASIVGNDARVYRDFRLPRAFRLNVGENAEVALT
jgi:glucose-1-phosphate thymidylyltransferase